ncbi:hypothetical protein [Catenulispora rubra]|uniref:hypothetical protein n=1 Tax=Catenulispora rubra TaxID=280293 RepID=UPI00189202FE|nr:hypothetical protein [Catenulispora rubra]
MTERWETIEALNAARTAMEARLGWEQPVAWGLLTPDGAVVRANVRGGYLPAVAVATVVGHRKGSRSYPLTAAAIAEAIAMAEPGEACTDIPHPNIAALRLLGGGDAVVAYVSEADFVEDAEGIGDIEEVEDRYVAALLAEIRRGFPA